MLTKAQKVYEKAIDAYSGIKNIEEVKNNKGIMVVFKMQYFSTYAVSDFLYLQLIAFRQNNQYMKKQIMRYMSIIVFEAMNDFEKLKGKEYINNLERYGDKDIKENLFDIYRNMRVLKAKHEKDLAEIRNQIGAHRNFELFDYYYSDIDYGAFSSFCTTFMSYLSSCNYYNNMLLNKMINEIC